MTPMQWICSSDVGVSSKTIWSVMMGAVYGTNQCSSGMFDVPHDPSDFGRCFQLLEYFPEWRERISEVAERFPKWKPMAERWNELEQLYREEYPSGKAPKLFALLQELEDEGMLLDGWERTGQNSWQRKKQA